MAGDDGLSLGALLDGVPADALVGFPGEPPRLTRVARDGQSLRLSFKDGAKATIEVEEAIGRGECGAPARDPTSRVQVINRGSAIRFAENTRLEVSA